MKDARPFEGTVSDKSSGELSDQKRLSILSRNAGPKRGNVANVILSGPRGVNTTPQMPREYGAKHVKKWLQVKVG